MIRLVMPLRTAIAAALLVAVVGCQVPPGTDNVGPSPSAPTVASPSAPTVAPTIAPTVAPTRDLWRNGVIAVAKDGDILVADRPGGDLRPLVAGPENDHSPNFSPDGTRLAFRRATELESFITIADADGTDVLELAPAFSLSPFATSVASFTPDGESLVAYARVDGEVRVVVLPVDPNAAVTVLDIRLPQRSEGDADNLTFSPTNPEEILVVGQPEPGDLDGTYPRGIYVYNLATGSARTIVEPVSHRYVQDVAWLPDGEHIIYNLGLEPHIVAADGSGDRVVEALRNRISPLSNDGTRIVVDGQVEDVPGDDSQQRSVVVPIDGGGKGVELACGLGMPMGCALSWTWSPDDSMLIGTVLDVTSYRYLLADPVTGQVTELDWVDVYTPAWQRVAP